MHFAIYLVIVLILVICWQNQVTKFRLQIMELWYLYGQQLKTSRSNLLSTADNVSTYNSQLAISSYLARYYTLGRVDAAQLAMTNITDYIIKYNAVPATEYFNQQSLADVGITAESFAAFAQNSNSYTNCYNLATEMSLYIARRPWFLIN